MDKIDYKEEFLNYNNFSDSISKAYKAMFKKVMPLEDTLNKDVKDFNESDMPKLLKILSSKSYHSLNVKWSLIKKYMIAYNNETCNIVTQDILKKYVKNGENSSRYISRNTLHNRIKNLVNPQDQAMLLLLFEGLFGIEYDEILNLRVDQINTETCEIHLEDRIVSVSDYTNQILKEAISKKEYYKKFTVGVHDMTTNESYLINPSSKYLIKTKPSNRTSNGTKPLGFEGFKSKIAKLVDEIGLEKTSPLTIYHSGMIEKILQEEEKRKKELSLTEIKKLLIGYGAKKIQPAIIRRAVDLYKKNYRI